MVSGHGRKYDSGFGVKMKMLIPYHKEITNEKTKKESTIIFTGSCTADYKLFLRGCNAGDGSRHPGMHIKIVSDRQRYL